MGHMVHIGINKCYAAPSALQTPVQNLPLFGLAFGGRLKNVSSFLRMSAQWQCRLCAAAM